MMCIMNILVSRSITNGSPLPLQVTATFRKEMFIKSLSFFAKSKSFKRSPPHQPSSWNSNLLQIVKSFHSKMTYERCRVFCSKFFKRNFLKNTPFQTPTSRLGSTNLRSFDINTNLHEDVLLYTHKNDNFFKMLSYFGIFQMGMWGYISLFSVRHLRAAPAEITDTSGLPWWKVLLYKEGQFKNALSVLCLAVGGIVLFITLTYPRRVVKNLWILKGGKEVQITTHTWLGRTQTFKKPLEHLNYLQSRAGNSTYIPFKIKGNHFYYLIDKQGSFQNTDLFDFVVCLKRNLK